MFPVYCKTCKKVVHYFSDYDEAKKKNEKGFECFSCFAKRNTILREVNKVWLK